MAFAIALFLWLWTGICRLVNYEHSSPWTGLNEIKTEQKNKKSEIIHCVRHRAMYRGNYEACSCKLAFKSNPPLKDKIYSHERAPIKQTNSQQFKSIYYCQKDVTQWAQTCSSHGLIFGISTSETFSFLIEYTVFDQICKYNALICSKKRHYC